MSLFNTTRFDSLNDLFLEQIRDLYDAEQRITKALPKMMDAAHAPALKQAFKSHLQQTEGHISRLEQVFSQVGADKKRETCLAMKGIIEEGENMIAAEGDADVKDAALIAAAQRVEHYEMAGYGTARTFAETLGLNQAATLLEATLKEEKDTDSKLTKLAESGINREAAAATRA